MSEPKSEEIKIQPSEAINIKKDPKKAETKNRQNRKQDILKKNDRLHHFFEQSCDNFPGNIAVEADDSKYSYYDVERQANKLANYLLLKGVKPETSIGLIVDSAPEKYIALLAILKCHATLVPLDSSFPSQRLKFIIDDAQIEFLISESDWLERFQHLCENFISIDSLDDSVLSDERPSLTLNNDDDDDICYIIYTSGTTGKPKGVAVTHDSICNFISVAFPLYEVTSKDRVYQGIILAFDFSFEEIWITFTQSATLVTCKHKKKLLGDELGDFLVEKRVTVFYCVPTLLGTIKNTLLPDVHTLVVGGELCPSSIVEKWWNNNRRILNTYGPTETTVTATWCELKPRKLVTIGKPLPSYEVYILDEKLNLQSELSVGEICISGPGVAKGYVNLPEKTSDKFVNIVINDELKRIYKTGDIGRFLEDGNIEYLGRQDQQVKIHGYRIELSEIEAQILTCSEIDASFVTLGKNSDDYEFLVAYVKTKVQNTAALKPKIHKQLRQNLPEYMIPRCFEFIDEIPTLSNGKVNKSKLPLPQLEEIAENREIVKPRNQLELKLLEVWSDSFNRKNISIEDDFFYDLGGHSLLAASVVSALRDNKIQVSIADLYSSRTIKELAKKIAILNAENQSSNSNKYRNLYPDLKRAYYSSFRVWRCGFVHIFWLLVVGSIYSVPWCIWKVNGFLDPDLYFDSLITLLIYLSLPILGKWLLLGKSRPGKFKLWGWYCCRWGLVRKLIATSIVNVFTGTPYINFYLKLLGANIGKNIYMASPIHFPDLIEIGDNVSIGYGVQIKPYKIEKGWVIQDRIEIKSGSYIGTNSVISLGSTIGSNTRVYEHTLISEGQNIEGNCDVYGSPSSVIESNDEILDQIEELADIHNYSSLFKKSWFGNLRTYGFGIVLLGMLPLISFLPGILTLVNLDFSPRFSLPLWPVVFLLAGLINVLAVCSSVVLFKKIFIGDIKPGIYPINSNLGYRKWLFDKIISFSVAATNSLYSTLYTPPFLRLLGAKIGKFSEISTIAGIDPSLLHLGSMSFLADIATIGSAQFYKGFFHIYPTIIGEKAFIGNAATVSPGTVVADDSLLGVHSVLHKNNIRPGTTWLGSPAIFFPKRQESEYFGDSLTYSPSWKLVLSRLFIEFWRVILPSCFTCALAFGFIQYYVWAIKINLSFPLFTLSLTPVYFALAFLLTLLVVAIKWILIGKYKPIVRPLWSNFVRRTELVTALYESIVVPCLLSFFTGTPFWPVILRLFGAKIGRRVYSETTYLTEFDLVKVGHDSAIESSTSLQTHLFEDRVMKVSNISIANKCSIGSRTIILYDSHISSDSTIDSLSLIMKGEKIPSHTKWRGIPSKIVVSN